MCGPGRRGGTGGRAGLELPAPAGLPAWPLANANGQQRQGSVPTHKQSGKRNLIPTEISPAIRLAKPLTPTLHKVHGIAETRAFARDRTARRPGQFGGGFTGNYRILKGWAIRSAVLQLRVSLR